MRKLIVLMALLMASPAMAQEYRIIFAGQDGSGFTRNNLDISTTSTNVTGAVGAGITRVRVTCDHATATAGCYIAIAATGSARLQATTATGYFIPADDTVDLVMGTGETIAAITSTGTGTLIVHELTR